MHTLFADFLQRLDILFNDMNKAIEGLPVAALDWVPGDDMNSLCVLVVHTCGAMRYWIGDMGVNDPSGRIRDNEFNVSGLTADELRARIAESLAYAQKALNDLTLDDLSKSIPSPNHQGREFIVSWSLLHALEHTALHVGHAQITRQLWDQRDA